VLVVRSPGSYGTFMFGSDGPLSFNEASLEEVLSRPGILEDLSAAPDAPTTTVAGWAAMLPDQVWLADGQAATWAGPGPEITDDRPLPEYFLLRRLTGCCEV
jgi:hypothetical protein